MGYGRQVFMGNFDDTWLFRSYREFSYIEQQDEVPGQYAPAGDSQGDPARPAGTRLSIIGSNNSLLSTIRPAHKYLAISLVSSERQ